MTPEEREKQERFKKLFAVIGIAILVFMAVVYYKQIVAED
jgi:hypothetical protein